MVSHEKRIELHYFGKYWLGHEKSYDRRIYPHVDDLQSRDTYEQWLEYKENATPDDLPVTKKQPSIKEKNAEQLKKKRHAASARGDCSQCCKYKKAPGAQKCPLCVVRQRGGDVNTVDRSTLVLSDFVDSL